MISAGTPRTPERERAREPDPGSSPSPARYNRFVYAFRQSL